MRVVVKLGTSTVTHETGQLNIRRVELLCKTLADLQNAGNQVLVVSSGAIGMGVGKLHLPGRPEDVPTRQAAAAVGQCELMYTYDRLFGKYNHTVGQMLLTAEDIQHEGRRQNVEATLFRLLELGAIPIINENDSVATAEIEGGEIGDNDTLSAEVAVIAKADLLVLLTDIPGLFTADPRHSEGARLIPVVEEITEELMAAAGEAGTGFGTGGMRTKLAAARVLQKHGIDMVITNGQNPESLYEVVAGLPVGTRFNFRKKGGTQ
ncbi:glutamate 5-kinase [Ruminococcaceae bacterium OttesenSCG-928-O06]|nr:glutamate 5-kinase [Ruminococcaceae bacterium OttesenSCG-928-O06]